MIHSHMIHRKWVNKQTKEIHSKTYTHSKQYKRKHTPTYSGHIDTHIHTVRTHIETQ